MHGTSLAIIEIDFRSRRVELDDIHAVVRLLRETAGVDDFSVQYGRITFHLWGEKQVDFSILDKIKSPLSKKYPGLYISASEYKQTGREYLYDAKKSK